MALSGRRRRRTRVALLAAVAMGAAFGAGLLAGIAFRPATPSPTLADRIAGLQEEVRAINRSLEAMQIEYADAYAGGPGSELAGALRHYDAAKARFDSIKVDLNILDANATVGAGAKFAVLKDRVTSRATPADVGSVVDGLMADLKRAARM